MNRRLMILCAVMFLVALAVPAFAAVQNVKVSGDIDAKWIVRDNFSLGQDVTFKGTKDNENFLNTITRVRVDADLTDNVSATVRLLNERDWSDEGGTATSVPSVGATGDTAIDLDLAYVTLKEMLYSPLTVIIGRQNLRYGNAFIIGDPDTNRLAVARSGVAARDLSARKAFDAVRAILNYDPLTIDLIYSKIKAGLVRSSTSVDANHDDMDLFGINVNYKLGDKYNTVAEAYLFSRIDNNTFAPPASGSKADTVYNPGLRLATNPIKGLNMQAEVAWQTGNKANASATSSSVAADNRGRNAIAWQILGNYALQIDKLMKYAPMAGLEYTHYSGEKNPSDSGAGAGVPSYKAWDPMFEDQAGGMIYNALFAATDTNAFNAHVSMKPIEDVTVRLDYTNLFLDQKLPRGTTSLAFLGQDTGASFSSAVNEGEKHMGQEVDGTITYDYTEDVQFGLTAGVFAPGKLFRKASTTGLETGHKSASQVITSCKVVF